MTIESSAANIKKPHSKSRATRGLSRTENFRSDNNVTITTGTAVPTVSLPTYSGITLTETWGTPLTSGTLSFADALNNGDITNHSLPADNATAGYTPVIYFSITNAGSQDVSFGTAFPKVTVSAGSLPYTTCELDIYDSPQGSNTVSWNNPGGPSGIVFLNSVTIGPGTIPSGTVDFPGQSQSAGAIACK